MRDGFLRCFPRPGTLVLLPSAEMCEVRIGADSADTGRGVGIHAHEGRFFRLVGADCL